MQQNTQNSSKTIFIITAVVLAAAAIYYFYYSGASTASSADSTLSASGISDNSAVGQKVLALLNQINSLHIDTKFFEGSAYQSLVDFSVQIPPVQVGRPNPFSNFGSFVAPSTPSTPASVPASSPSGR